jgi:hypothetical protein
MSMLIAIGCVSVFAISGCSQGPPFHEVFGEVVFKKDDSPAQFGSIEFRSESEERYIARGTIQKDGSFKLKTGNSNGAYEGWYTVVIVQAAGNTRAPKIAHNHGLDVAKKYADHRTTDLRVEITAESAEDLRLEVDHEKRR